MNNVTWTKKDITNIINQLADQRFVKYNDIMFLRLEESTTDSVQDEFYEMTRAAGGAAAIQLNIGPLFECVEEGSTLAAKLVEGKTKMDDNPVTVMVIDAIFAMDPRVPEFIIAHELGHIVNGDTVSEIENKDPMGSELKADRFATDVVGDNKGMKIFFQYVFDIIEGHLTAPAEVKEKAYKAINQRLDQFKNEGVVA